ncbi:hypothetical protein CF336_g6448, partial [Tilletia laevis]
SATLALESLSASILWPRPSGIAQAS